MSKQNAQEWIIEDGKPFIHNYIPSICLNKGYELYKVLPNGNLSLFKSYDKKITRKDLTGIKI